MEEGGGNILPFKYPVLDFLFTVVGLVFFLLDIVLDIWAVVSFYQEEAYVYMGLLVFLLVGSSLLVQAFSLLWFLYDTDGKETKTESLVKNISSLKVLHVFQMGVFLRYAGVVRISICGFCCKKPYEGESVFQTHDLNMLRLFETFAESAPQLVLMLTVVIRSGVMEVITLLKTLGSVGAISVSVTMYHRSLRNFLPDKIKQGWGSSVVYFLWNLLLIGPRVAAVALFTSVFPCYIAAHFLSYWMVLFFFVRCCKTDFMEGTGGECLYRATVGLILYFSWFNVERGQSRWKSTFYHIWIAVDIGMLCGLWVWQMKINPPYFDLPLDPYVILGLMMSLYLAGLGLMGIYYKYCHPNTTQSMNQPEEPMMCLMATSHGEDEVDFRSMTRTLHGEDEVDFRSMTRSTEHPKAVARVNKRMKNLADNFYS
ncbi:hypothetical protein UPYG_G00331900 [Umbra pygmaea]|uniref:XK-related protein n=1 Tax=Umbra pygmaea TaxID=75934 RepID=A0ABD0VW94_UMBPY